MKNIIVVGYPKSGNTWITRLTAELVGCPVKGFWNYPNHNEIAIEGSERSSEYSCFKAHQTFSDLAVDPTNIGHQIYIIYVIRDPRDIVISGAKFFGLKAEELPKWLNLTKKTLLKFPKGHTISSKMITEPFKISRMANAVLNGSSKVHKWCSVSWQEHYCSYLKQNCIFVRYEDMLINPMSECKKILQYLGIARDDREICEAIRQQSFYNKKKEFEKKGESGKASFLRKGQSGQWKNHLTPKQRKKIVKSLEKDLILFRYHT